jgi:hypothetical protein
LHSVVTRSFRLVAFGALAAATLVSGPVFAETNFFQGFETDTDDWSDVTRVASGTHGVPSSSGAYHAESEEHSGSFTRFDGYENEFPATGYTTKLDVYLDVESGVANDTRFDWSSAMSTPAGGHRRDFIFNAGFYNDTDATGDGPRYVISASNNGGRSGAFPKNPARDPLTITETGWYTLQHTFYDNGSGVLAVDLSVLDSSGGVLNTWTLSDPSDVIDVTVGGHRYGWVVNQEFPFLAIDNTVLITLIGPPTSADECKEGGWKEFNNPSFKNQGDCVSYVASEGRAGGNP